MTISETDRYTLSKAYFDGKSDGKMVARADFSIRATQRLGQIGDDCVRDGNMAGFFAVQKCADAIREIYEAQTAADNEPAKAEGR